MVITYHGGECFKITFGETVLAINPISKESGLRSVRFGADIVLVSLDHPDMNGTDQVSRDDRDLFIVNGPGEYEVKRVFIRGFLSRSDYGLPAQAGGGDPASPSQGGHINTIYTIRMEGMNLCFLGALSEKKLPAKVNEALDGIDILFVPIGGDGVLSALPAHELSVELESALVIPMHYSSEAGALGKKDALKQFLKEEGAGELKAVDKLTAKKKDLEGKQGEVIVLSG